MKHLVPSSRSGLASHRLLLLATVTCALLAGFTSIAFAQSAATPTNGPVTRAQVLADLKAYQDSGLAALERDDSRQWVGTDVWRAARARYFALRHIPSRAVTMQALSRTDVVNDLKLYRESGLAAVESRDGEESNDSAALQAAQARYDELSMPGWMMQRPLTRAEVLADLQVYQESGLAAFDRSEGELARSSNAYQAAKARYEQLRNGARYQSLVMQRRQQDQHG